MHRKWAAAAIQPQRVDAWLLGLSELVPAQDELKVSFHVVVGWL